MGPTRATRAYSEATLPIPADIYDKVSSELQKKGYDCECLGGGRISHQSQDRKIHVYGYSMVSSSPQASVQTAELTLVNLTPSPATQATSGILKVGDTENPDLRALVFLSSHFPYDTRVVGSQLSWAAPPFSLIVLCAGSLGALGAVRAEVKLTALIINISFHKDHPAYSLQTPSCFQHG